VTPAKPWGLTSRLAVRLAAMMVVAMALAAGVVAWRTLLTIRELDDVALQDQARLVAGQIAAAPGGGLRLDLPPRIAAGFQDLDSGSLFAVLDETGKVLFTSSPVGATALLPYLPHGREGMFRVPPSQALPGGLIATTLRGPHWTVVVGQAHEQREVLVASLLREFTFSALWLLAPIGAAVVLIAVFTTLHGLRPLRAAAAAARRIAPDRPGQRLPAAGLPSELVPLVGTVNAALDRLERALAAQRRFVGEAAHALRTPLAVLTARIDALDGPETAALRQDCDRMARLVTQMLTMARLEGAPLALSDRIDLHAIAAEAVSALAPLAIGRGIDLALLEGPAPPPLPGNHAALVLAAENLIDNAISFSPLGATVEVALEAPATLSVSDRGPGVPEGERQAIFARFHSSRHGGAGLGLAIVAEIAAAHGGTVAVEDRPGGGAVFRLSLPART
jgi:signal transduction histidine kinase